MAETDIFGDHIRKEGAATPDTVPSPATAKAPESQDHLPAAPEPSPVQPRMTTLAGVAKALRRLSYFDMLKLAKDVETRKKNNVPLAEALATWANDA